MSTSSKPQKVTLDDREFPLRGPEPLEADRERQFKFLVSAPLSQSDAVDSAIRRPSTLPPRYQARADSTRQKQVHLAVLRHRSNTPPAPVGEIGKVSRNESRSESRPAVSSSRTFKPRLQQDTGYRSKE
ncbi:hypothetical protein PCASD_17437 [Puccinia coronata f. sp. avenae]|uniref:Uncharacterized protein n=1 Tax=Puccinia coronata f. sp. avenae TaxID=200324 RepID=A0A2N5T5E8_9BASI|nr:hypothetical protein PCASD_17437 [Puccinia coronata f. sp. avenae]